MPNASEMRKDMDILSYRYVVLDTETAPRKDLKPLQTEVIEIGWVVIENGMTVSSQSTLVKPYYTIPQYVSEALGITNVMVAEAPDITLVIPDLLKQLSGSVLVGHNVQYDINAVVESLSRRPQGYMYTNYFNTAQTIDTMRLFAKLFPQSRKRLKDMLAVLNIEENQSRHRAEADANYTALSLLKLLHTLRDTYKVKTLQSLVQFIETGDPYIQTTLF